MTEPSMRVVECSFKQDADCCQSGVGDDQQITVKEDNGGIDDEDRFYVIETERWSFNSIEELVEILRRAGCRETFSEANPLRPNGRRIISEAI